MNDGRVRCLLNGFHAQVGRRGRCSSAGRAGASAVLWLPFSGSRPSLHEAFPAAPAELLPSLLGSNEAHRGHGWAARVFLMVSRHAGHALFRGALAPLGSHAVALAVEEGFVLWARGAGTRPGERVWCCLILPHFRRKMSPVAGPAMKEWAALSTRGSRNWCLAGWFLAAKKVTHGPVFGSGYALMWA